MSAPTPVSVEDYLRTEYTPKCEYVDGVLIEKPWPTWKHSLIQGSIAALINQLFPAFAAGGDVNSRLRPTEFRLPDVAVDFIDRALHSDYAELPLYLSVEVLSPGDRLGETFAKCERYHDWGVPYCWVIDPEKRRGWEYPKGGEPIEVHGSIGAGDIRLELADIFKTLDRLR
jgi:Uma2 family endonuclease